MGVGTVKLVLRLNRRRSDGSVPIYLRLTRNRRVRFLATGIYVRPEDWNAERQEVRRTHPLHATYNRHLRNWKLQAEKALLETGSADRAKLLLKGGGHRLLLELGQEQADRLLEAGRFWSYKQQRVLLAKLKAYQPNARLEDLTPTFVKGFQRFLERIGNGPNTIRKNLQCLRRLWRYTVEQGLLDPAHDPFRGVQLPKEVIPERRRLSFEDLKRLAQLELPPPPAVEALARDAFLLATYSGGVRFGDLCRLTLNNLRGLESDRCWLCYRMRKTGRLLEVPLPPVALEIIRRWDGPWRPFIFPFLRPHDLRDENAIRRRISSANAIVNQQLKRLARMAGIERPETLSMHVARHSVADLARRFGDLYTISKLLGHANVRITERYLASFDRQALEELACRLWSE
ncbi:MAG: site-specific integrase [Rhodothermus sp.]|nr:site-specific integrase [Rhodothermus sp.]